MYFVRPFSYPCTVNPGDRFNMSVTGRDGKKQQVCSREITTVGLISHWAYVDIPGIGLAYFIGNGNLAEYLVEQFPGAKLEKNPKMT